jgi:hypothetical protein
MSVLTIKYPQNLQHRLALLALLSDTDGMSAQALCNQSDVFTTVTNVHNALSAIKRHHGFIVEHPLPLKGSKKLYALSAADKQRARNISPVDLMPPSWQKRIKAKPPLVRKTPQIERHKAELLTQLFTSTGISVHAICERSTVFNTTAQVHKALRLIQQMHGFTVERRHIKQGQTSYCEYSLPPADKERARDITIVALMAPRLQTIDKTKQQLLRDDQAGMSLDDMMKTLDKTAYRVKRIAAKMRASGELSVINVGDRDCQWARPLPTPH